MSMSHTTTKKYFSKGANENGQGRTPAVIVVPTMTIIDLDDRTSRHEFKIAHNLRILDRGDHLGRSYRVF